MGRTGIAIALFLVTAFPVAAEPLPISLDDAIARARSVSATVAAREADAAGAEASLGEARASRLPSVDLTTLYTRLSHVPELAIDLPGSGTRTIFPDLPDRGTLRAGVSVPLYSGGAIAAGIDGAAHRLDAAGAASDSERADVALETIAAYWSLATATETVRVLREGMAAYEQHLADARNREALGLAPRNEVLAVAVDRDRAELALVRAELSESRASADLARLLDLPPGSEPVPTDALARAKGTDGSVESLVAQALASRPERAALEALVDAARARIRVERAVKRPRVTAEAGFDWANPNTRVLPLERAWEETWDVSLRLGWRLFDGGKTSSAVRRAEAEVEAAARRLEDLERRIRLEVTSRWLDLRAAERALPVAERAVEAAAEAERIAGDRHREGLLPSFERLDAERRRLAAGLDRTEALARAAVARAALDRAVGRL